jgi:hypothetical protein
MNTIIKEIAENDFYNSKNPLLFESDGLNRKFALISNNDVHYIIGWQSDLVNPKVFELTRCDTSIGIDLNFAIIDFCQNKVLAKMELAFNFIDIVKVKNRLFLITELEVLELEAENYSVINTFLLPDIIEEIIVTEDIIKLRCADGKDVRLDVFSIQKS